MEDGKVLKKMKALIRYLFDDFEDGDKLKSAMLRSKDYETFQDNLSQAKASLSYLSRTQ